MSIFRFAGNCPIDKRKVGFDRFDRSSHMGSTNARFDANIQSAAIAQNDGLDPSEPKMPLRSWRSRGETWGIQDGDAGSSSPQTMRSYLHMDTTMVDEWRTNHELL